MYANFLCNYIVIKELHNLTLKISLDILCNPPSAPIALQSVGNPAFYLSQINSINILGYLTFNRYLEYFAYFIMLICIISNKHRLIKFTYIYFCKYPHTVFCDQSEKKIEKYQLRSILCSKFVGISRSIGIGP